MEPANTLRIKTLAPEWSDKDNIMLHACFQLLTDCIEKEHLLTGHVDWTYSDAQKKVKEEIEALYQWWQERCRKESTDDFDWVWTKGQYEKDTQMLTRLVAVRQYLWT